MWGIPHALFPFFETCALMIQLKFNAERGFNIPPHSDETNELFKSERTKKQLNRVCTIMRLNRINPIWVHIVESDERSCRPSRILSQDKCRYGDPMRVSARLTLLCDLPLRERVLTCCLRHQCSDPPPSPCSISRRQNNL